jgi:regulatory protein
MSENALYKTALNKMMAQCSRREFCSEDIRDKLQLWGLKSDDTVKIINILIKENFLNELRFSTAFVKDRFNYNKWGKVKISAHLRAKKITDNIIRTALDSIDDEIYKKVLKDLITGHKKSVKAKNRYDLKAKLLRFGLSKGFESHLLYDILNDYEE